MYRDYSVKFINNKKRNSKYCNKTLSIFLILKWTNNVENKKIGFKFRWKFLENFSKESISVKYAISKNCLAT